MVVMPLVAMAKKGTYNGTFFGNFSSRLHGTPVRFGLLLGQEVENGLGDVLFAAATPPLDEEGDADAAPKDVASLLKSSSAGVSFSDWAVQHTSAVRKLLPAAMAPLGCFVVASEQAAKELAALLVPILRGFPEPLVLSIDPSTRKSSFWQLSVGAKPALRPAQMKADSYKDYLLLWSVVNVDVFVQETYSPDANIDDLATEVSRVVAESLKSCVVTVASDTGVPQVVELASESTVETVTPKECHQLKVSFLRPGSVLRAGEGPVRQRCVLTSSALLLRRNIELRRAVAQLMEEIASSSAERLRLALEECEKPGRFLNLPWRGLFSPEDLQFPLWLGDYLMPDESHAAAKERLGQLLGVQDEALEQAPDFLDEHKLLTAHVGTYGPEPGSDRAQGKAPKASTSGSSGSSGVPVALTTCVAMVVLILAVAMHRHGMPLT